MGLSWLVPAVSAIGAVFLAAPVIIHLLFRQKPKRLPFPALRLIQQRKRQLMRKLRLRHLLLLALRLLLLGGAIAALGRPLLSGAGRLLPVGSPIAAILIFDTSASMSYQLEGQTRLQRAQTLAGEYLRSLPEGSRVAVVDSAEVRVQFRDRHEAQVLLDSLAIRYHNRPVLFAVREVLRQMRQPDDKWPRLPTVVCVFSDRTAASWNAEAAGEIRELRAEIARSLEHLSQEEEAAEAPQLPMLYFDLAPPRPINVAITGISLAVGEGGVPLEKLPYGVNLKQPVQLQVDIRGVGAPVDLEVELVVGEQLQEVRRFQIAADEGQGRNVTVRFRPFVVAAPVLQGRVRLRSPDLLEADNVRYWTLLAQQYRVGLVADQAGDVQIWKNALEALSLRGLLPVEVHVWTPDQMLAELPTQPPEVLCLLNVSKPSEQFWQRVRDYLRGGGRVVLGLGADLAPSAYNTAAAGQVLPVSVQRSVDLPFDTFVEVADYGAHPLLVPYRDWNTDLTVGRVYRVWQVEMLRQEDQPLGQIIARISHEAKPLIIERVFEGAQGAGRLLLFTTPLYRRTSANWSDWNNFYQPWQTNFALPFVTVRYLLQAQSERTNWLLGEDLPSVLLPATAEPGFSWELRGPETRSGTLEQRQRELFFERLDRPGNYTVRDLQEKWLRAFSTNLPPQETEFLEGRISEEELRATFGDNSLLPSDSPVHLVELARARLGQNPPLELLPFLLMLVVVLLALESWVANRFYKPQAEEAEHV
ncbi:MAG: BatA domain-containing protein [Gemmatales bacterium]|nr:BatA domain-containing protein [Gemmatales bacterium]MDW8175207.1 BatA domain-containing protein [Gemmatales bacterium]